MEDVEYWINPPNRNKAIYLNSMHFSGLLFTLMGPNPYSNIDIPFEGELLALLRHNLNVCLPGISV